MKMPKFLFTGIVFMLLLFMFSCEHVQPLEATNQNGILTDIIKLNADASEPDALPTNLKWHWRRVMVEGSMRYSGTDNINGDYAYTGQLIADYFDFNIEGSGTQWGASGISVSRSSTNPFAGTYCLNADPFFATNSFWGYAYTFNLPIGSTMSAEDSIVCTQMVRTDNANIALLSLNFKKWNGNYADSKSVLITTQYNSWTQVNIFKPSLAAKSAAIQYQGSVNINNEIWLDDIRLYSSASALPPPCRITNMSLYYNSKTGMYEFEGDISDWYSEEGSVELNIMFEDSETGLYKYFSATNVALEAGDKSVFYRFFLSDDAQELENGSDVRILTYVNNVKDMEGAYKHINEFDAFTTQVVNY